MSFKSPNSSPWIRVSRKCLRGQTHCDLRLLWASPDSPSWSSCWSAVAPLSLPCSGAGRGGRWVGVGRGQGEGCLGP